MKILDLIKKVGEQESSLTKKVIVSPIFHNDTIVTKLCGLNYTFEITKQEPGWYKFKPHNAFKARKYGLAEPDEIERYLKLLPQIRITLAYKKNSIYYGIPMKNNNLGIPENEVLEVYLVDDIPMDFDRVLARYDGENFWYESLDMSNDPSKGLFLRECFEKRLSSDKVRYKGLTFDEKIAYAIRTKIDEEFKKSLQEGTLKGDVEHSGGKFISFIERRDHYAVTLEVDGQRYTAHVGKDRTHRVISAGICLSGEDTKFDLKSLISLYRRGQQNHMIHRVR